MLHALFTLLMLAKLCTLVRAAGRVGGGVISVAAEVGVVGVLSNGLDMVENVDDDDDDDDEEETALSMLILGVAAEPSAVVDDMSSIVNTTDSLSLSTLTLPTPSKRSPTLGTLKTACRGGGSSTSKTPCERACFSCVVRPVLLPLRFAPPLEFAFRASPPRTSVPESVDEL
jgi:hypothetical protein